MTLNRRALLAATACAALVPGLKTARADSGPRSGLPWHSGVSDWDFEAFAEWRGRPLDVLVVFSKFLTWNQMARLGRSGTLLGEALDRPERLSISLAMFPRDDGPVPRDNPEIWLEAARGAYDERWDAGLAYLQERMLRLDPIFRPGWEWNGANMPWRVTDPAYAEPYIESFRRLVGLIKARWPFAEIDWCGLKRSETEVHLDEFYPGDDVVDYVGHDRYDRGPAARTQEDWRRVVSMTDDNGPRGVEAWIEYAASKGKRFSVPEWGVWSEEGRGGGGAGDNPRFVEGMFELFDKHKSNLGYECYFNQNGGDARHKLTPGGGNPEAGDAYLRLYRDA